jgi:hypothetical protein
LKVFTYAEFIRYRQYANYIKGFEHGLREEGEEYHYEQNTIYHQHDKIFREVLEDKREVASLINKVLKLENKKEALKEDDLERCNGKFVSNSFNYAEADMIYRKKGEDVFFLIEHKSTIDYSMPYRILMYCLEILKRAIDVTKIGKSYYKIPMVYPIVIYTGKRKWNIEQCIEERQQKIPGCKPIRFYEYEIIDINDYSEQQLLTDKSFLSKLMLLEKSHTNEKIMESFRKILQEDLTPKNKDLLKRIVLYILREEIGKEEKEQLLKELVEKGGENKMIVERLRQAMRYEIRNEVREEVRGEVREEIIGEVREEIIGEVREKIKEEITGEVREEVKAEIQKKQQEIMKRQAEKNKEKMTKKMLKNNIKQELILEITGISKERLEKIIEKEAS